MKIRILRVRDNAGFSFDIMLEQGDNQGGKDPQKGRER